MESIEKIQGINSDYGSSIFDLDIDIILLDLYAR